MTSIKPIDLNVNSSIYDNIDMPYVPDQNCFDWCLIQQVSHSNNLELYSVMFVLAGYFSIVIYYILNEFEKTRKFAYHFIYIAKLMLLVFLGIYVIVIRYRFVY